MPNPITPPESNPTLSNLSGMAEPYQQQLEQDQDSLAGVNQDISKIPDFTEQQPQINRNGVMATAPILIGLAALGGGLAKVHAKTMLNATNGMMKGLIQGNQKAYEDARVQYDDRYQKYLDKYKTQLQIFNEMRQVYKGRVDADLRALEIARKATGDQTKVDANSVKQWQWEQDHTSKLENAEEARRHNMATESNTSVVNTERQRHDVAIENKPGAVGGTPAQQAKSRDYDSQINRARQLIKELKTLAGKKSSIAGVPAAVTGVSGHAARISESIGNVLGISDDTTARDFESKNSELQVLLPKLLTKSGYSSKDVRDKVATIARGLKFGDTPQNTVSALDDLDRSLVNAPSESKFIIGKVYKDAQGNEATYMEDGTWQRRPKK